MPGHIPRLYEFGPFRLVPDERQLLRDNQVLELTPKAFDLLVVLVENRGHLVAKDALLEQIWPDSFVEESNLSVKMSALRRVLGEGPRDQQYVQTISGRGYRFVAEVRASEAYEDGAQPTELDRPNSGEASAIPLPEAEPSPFVPNAAKQRAVWMIGLGLLVLAVLLFVFDAGGLRRRTLTIGRPIRVDALAVLPFENLSEDTSQEYFAEGLTDALNADLSKVSALRVVARPTVNQYKGTSKSLAEIGRELNVDALIIGSIVRSGDRVRVTVQLVRPAEDRTLWGNSYDRAIPEVQALRNELRQDIFTEIGVKLTAEEQQHFESRRPLDSNAYDRFLRGRYYAQHQTRDDNAAAIKELEESVAIDPDYAAAYAELAQAYVWKLFLFAPEDRTLAEKAFMASEKALTLNPDMAVAYLARGRLLWTPANHFPHEKAIQEYNRALAIDPNLDEARNQLALVYCHIGAFDEALEQSQKAMSTNPGNNLAQFRTGQTLNFQGRYDDALRVLNGLSPDVNPALVGQQTAWALFNLGRTEEASVKLEQLLKDYPNDEGGLFTSIQAVIAASAGRNNQAEELIQLAISKGKGFGHFHHTAYHIACAFALMNKRGDAVKWLETAADGGFPCYPLFERDDNLKNLRQDSRFATFLAGQRQQWESYKSAL